MLMPVLIIVSRGGWVVGVAGGEREGLDGVFIFPTYLFCIVGAVNVTGLDEFDAEGEAWVGSLCGEMPGRELL